MARKIRDRQDALTCLEAVQTSGMRLTPWARAHGVDARSLNCWRLTAAVTRIGPSSRTLRTILSRQRG